VNFILYFSYVIDKLMPCVSLCIVHMCMITVLVHLCILLCAAENDGDEHHYRLFQSCLGENPSLRKKCRLATLLEYKENPNCLEK